MYRKKNVLQLISRDYKSNCCCHTRSKRFIVNLCFMFYNQSKTQLFNLQNFIQAYDKAYEQFSLCYKSRIHLTKLTITHYGPQPYYNNINNLHKECYKIIIFIILSNIYLLVAHKELEDSSIYSKRIEILLLHLHQTYYGICYAFTGKFKCKMCTVVKGANL